MKALTISLVVSAVLCGVMSAPASAMPMSNLAAAASDLGLGQSVRCNQYRCWSRPNYYRGSGYYGYGYGSYYGYGYPAYYGYYALRSEPGFYRRPYYGYYRGY